MEPAVHPLESILAAAVEIDAADERRAFVEQACAGDAELQRRVLQMIADHFEAGNFLEPVQLPSSRRGPQESGGPTLDEPILEKPGAMIGPYKLMEQIGEGGFGLVFVAEQTHPVRVRVALKVIKPGMDTRQVIARFEAERQALALMDHPNIAKVLDAGATGEVGSRQTAVGSHERRSGSLPTADCLLPTGRPYFVMELVKGVPITQFCDEQKLTPRQRLELFLSVCQAVQHAHQKGIIHRDLKPSNVLVTSHDGKPVVKVIDFGIAKAIGQQLTDKTVYTQLTQLIGTPLYMSPEQAGQSGLDVDTRSDIYSLGVLLYELLTGTTPFSKERFQQAAYDEIRRIIREEEPPKPSTRLSELSRLGEPSRTLGAAGPARLAGPTSSLASVSAMRQTEPAKLTKLVRGELDWIVMKALEKDRNRRYETANGFAMDVQRYLADEPVQACPPSAGYRLRKFVRRNKAALATAVLLLLMLLALVGGVAGVIGWAVRNRDALEREVAQDRATRQIILEKEVSRALDETAAAYKQDKLPAALAEVKRAEGLLVGGAANADLVDRVRRWRADLGFALRLEDTRLERVVANLDGLNWAGADKAYQQAFAAYDLDMASLAPAAVAERIRQSAIHNRVVAALDDWWLCKVRGRLPGRDELLDVIRQADADPLRAGFRAAAKSGDSAALVKFAEDPKALSHQPATVQLLADILANTGKLPAAIRLLEQAQQRYPGDFWINHDLAERLSSQKPPRAADAVSYVRVAVAQRPDSGHVQALLGFVLWQHKKPADAETAFRRALILLPNNARIHMNLGVVLREQGQKQEGVDEYRLAIRLKPDYAKARTNLASSLATDGLLPEAAAEYREIIRLGLLDVPARRKLVDILLKQKTLASVTEAYEEDCRLAPDDANVHFRYYERLAPLDADAAAAALKQAVDLQPNHLAAGFAFENSLLKQGKTAEAEAFRRQAIQRDPKDAAALCRLAALLNRLDKPTEAEQRCREAIQLDGDDAWAHNLLGQVLRRLQKDAEAEKEFLEAIRLKPKDWGAYSNLGLLRQAQNRLAEAEKDYRAAIACDPKAGTPHYHLGTLLERMGKLPEAQSAYREAIRWSPKFMPPRVALVNILLAQRKDAEAGPLIHEGLGQQPKDAGLRVAFGELLLSQGKTSEATAEFQEAVRLQPKNYTVRYRMAEAYSKHAKFDLAANAWADAAALLPDDPMPRCFQALALLGAKDLVGYKKLCQEALARSRDTKFPGTVVQVIRTCTTIPDAVADPRELLAAAKQIPPKSGFGDDIVARALYRAERYEEALRHLEESAQEVPLSSRDCFVLAMAHHRLGHAEQARKALAQGVIRSEKTKPGSYPWFVYFEDERLRGEAETLVKGKNGP